MRINVRLDDQAVRSLLDKLDGRAERASAARPAMEALADDFLAIETEAFRTEGRIFGGWRRNAAWWRDWKARQGGGRILEMPTPQGGRLRRSLTEKGAPWQVRRVSGSRIEVGTSLGIAGPLQRGGRAGEVSNIPARPIVRLRKVDRERWKGILGEYIATGSVAVSSGVNLGWRMRQGGL